MSNKSSDKLKTPRKTKKINRPFSPEILRKAKAIAEHYRIAIESDAEVGYIGRVLEMPGIMADGSTPQRCFEEVAKAAIGAVALMLEHGQTPPAAASDQKRTAQINVRVTEDERMRLEDAARRLGFRGVSDFVRTSALSNAS